MNLNDVTMKNMLSMPVIDELAGAEYFAILDMKFGFYQIRMLPTDEFRQHLKHPWPFPIQSHVFWIDLCDYAPNHISVFNNELYFWAIL
jgi:hypothetical protein